MINSRSLIITTFQLTVKQDFLWPAFLFTAEGIIYLNIRAAWLERI